MKRFTILFVLVFMLLGVGCAMQKHRKYVRDGLLVTGLNREAFLLEWGPPDKTQVIKGEEVTRAGYGIKGGFFFKAKENYDIWFYEKKRVDLVFLGLRLVAWKTEKTVEELKTLTPSKPQTLDEYSRERKEAPEKK